MHLVEAGVTGGVVAEQDVLGTVAVEVTEANHAVGGRGTADILPAGIDAGVDQIISGVAGCSIAVQDVACADVTGEVARSDDAVSRRGTTDVIPAGIGAGVHLIEPGVPGVIVAIQNVGNSPAVEVLGRRGAQRDCPIGELGDLYVAERIGPARNHDRPGAVGVLADIRQLL